MSHWTQNYPRRVLWCGHRSQRSPGPLDLGASLGGEAWQGLLFEAVVGPGRGLHLSQDAQNWAGYAAVQSQFDTSHWAA